jgi:hypothetical protein
MVEDANATVEAAEGILKMLREEAATFASEVRRHANNLAARMESYVQCCENGTAAMQTHRDNVLKVGAVVAENPAIIENKEPSDDDAAKNGHA